MLLSVLFAFNSFGYVVKDTVYDMDDENSKDPKFTLLREEKKQDGKRIVEWFFKDLSGNTVVYERVAYEMKNSKPTETITKLKTESAEDFAKRKKESIEKELMAE